MIDPPQQCIDHAGKIITVIKSLYLPEKKVLVELEDIKKAPRIKYTLQVNMVKRHFGIHRVLYSKFFNLATDTKPFLLNTMANIQPVDISVTHSIIVTVVFVWPVISHLNNSLDD